MYIIVNDNQILHDKSLKKINKQLESELKDSDFKSIGEDKIIIVTDKNLEFVKDIGRISNIPFDKLYKKDTAIKTILYLIILFNLAILIRG